jgi:hypothetical protein
MAEISHLSKAALALVSNSSTQRRGIRIKRSPGEMLRFRFFCAGAAPAIKIGDGAQRETSLAA